ncbi:MAG: hypothetical protein QJR07_02245 [Acetobacteraceae bacterium]|nr:hypothetical protein [Acetobacteraceae bacterium]
MVETVGAQPGHGRIGGQRAGDGRDPGIAAGKAERRLFGEGAVQPRAQFLQLTWSEAEMHDRQMARENGREACGCEPGPEGLDGAG